ncbi:hypothetical protein EDD37DRAFT_613714 [Exophiala viscosa]|uniref:uncharacterized protein n=1 Tax=Exophiala viscosa TaxID=2486360 RepID=UPI0021A170C2|nr:hypothetical protein EDD37DRAFT_613714 [Exophiala viscosa]
MDLQLPSLVLRTIAERLIEDLEDPDVRQETISTLCSLRLTCQELAEMWTIRAALFEELNLHATNDNLSRLRQTNIAKAFAPFVRSIRFYASPFSSDVDFQHFRLILFVQSVFEREPEKCHVCDYNPYENSGGRVLDLSVQEGHSRYAAYKTRTQDDANLITNGTLQCAWTSALSAFNRLESICLGSVTDTCEAGSFSLQRGVFPSRRDCCGSSQSFLSELLFTPGDLLASAVAQCLISSRRSLKSLTFGFELPITQAPKYWDSVSLEGLQELSFRPLPPPAWEEPRDEEEPGDEEEERYDTVWAKTMLETSHSTLRSFELVQNHRYGEIFYWDRIAIAKFNFLYLRRLRLDGVDFSSARLAADILRFEALTWIEISHSQPSGEVHQWKIIFDAIRQRPTPLHLRFHENYPGKRINAVCFDTSHEVHSAPSPIEWSLGRYLSNKGDWNTTLAACFGWS